MLSPHDTPQILTDAQIDAIKARAVSLWGEKWLPELVRQYAKVVGADERQKFAQVQRYIEKKNRPSIEAMNALLMAVNCRFSMTCYTVEVVDLSSAKL
jgi:hypothetical protein